jgi:hypothetical protein
MPVVKVDLPSDFKKKAQKASAAAVEVLVPSGSGDLMTELLQAAKAAVPVFRAVVAYLVREWAAKHNVSVAGVVVNGPEEPGDETPFSIEIDLPDTASEMRFRQLWEKMR